MSVLSLWDLDILAQVRDRNVTRAGCIRLPDGGWGIGQGKRVGRLAEQGFIYRPGPLDRTAFCSLTPRGETALVEAQATNPTTKEI